MDADKPVPVVNLPHVRFICGPSKQGRTGNIQGEWDPDILVAVIMALGVPVEEALSDIGKNSRIAAIHLECDGEEEWIKSLKEGCRTQSVEQLVEWLASPAPLYKAPNIYFLIAVFPGGGGGGGGGYDGKPEPSIKSWAQPVGALKDLLKNRCNLKVALVFCPYHLPN